jgi:transposase
MSLPPASLFTVPERTAAIAHAAFPKGNRYMQMRDTLGTVYTNAEFAGGVVWSVNQALSHY